MRRLLAAALLLVTAHTGAALADTPLNCEDARTTPEFNACADAAYTAADDKLNETYKSVLAFIKKSDGEKPYDAANWEKALRASQNAWIAFRDADCGGLVPMSWGGGTGTTVAVLGCKTAKTEARRLELIALYETESGDEAPADAPAKTAATGKTCWSKSFRAQLKSPQAIGTPCTAKNDEGDRYDGVVRR